MIVHLFLNVFKNFVLHARIKDIESRYQFIRNLVEHILRELCLPTENQYACLFTKSLDNLHFICP